MNWMGENMQRETTRKGVTIWRKQRLGGKISLEEQINEEKVWRKSMRKV